MRNLSKSTSYDVGYRKPPKETRFKPGVSGNSKGRPKKPFSTEDAISNVLRAKLPVTVCGKTVTMTNYEATLWGVLKEARSGNLRAMQVLLTLGERFDFEKKSKEVHPQLQGLFDALKAGPVETVTPARKKKRD